MQKSNWDGESIVIIDFGSQYTQLIARNIRSENVFSKILPNTATIAEISSQKPAGIILSGGPADVSEKNAPALQADIYSLNIPVLGVCYGMQLISKELGAVVEKTDNREYGPVMIDVHENSGLFEGTPENQKVWMSHGVRVKTLPQGFRTMASSEGCSIAAMENRSERIFGLQFHPEVYHTDFGQKIISNFLFNICKCKANWGSESYVDYEIAKIREKVGDAKVLCAVSGGVDSSVMALLVDRAIGKQLCPVFVDNGLLRDREAEEVKTLLAECLTADLIFVDASDEFLRRLEGVTGAEEKRKVIGRCFIDIFDKQSDKHGPFDFLAQGTLYPDVIESRSTVGPSETIKSHHNVGGLPENMKFELIEPLKMLFKDEVREVGSYLGLPEHQIKLSLIHI